MKTYVVYGYMRREHESDWEVYGLYTDRKEAERKVVELAGDFVDEYTMLGWHDTLHMECFYYDDKLREIYDGNNFEIIIRIAEKELKEEK